MKKKFSTLDVTRALGVAPSTGSVIAALLNGELHPQHYRALQQWPLFDMAAPPPVTKVMIAISELLELDPEAAIQTLWKGRDPICLFVDHQIDGQPTVIYDMGARTYLLNTIEEMFNVEK